MYGTDGGTLVEVGVGQLAVGPDVEVHHNLVALAAVPGTAEIAVERIGSLRCHAHQPVGQGDALASDMGRIAIEHSVGLHTLTIAILGIAGGLQPHLHHRAFIGREAELTAQPALAHDRDGRGLALAPRELLG